MDKRILIYIAGEDLFGFIKSMQHHEKRAYKMNCRMMRSADNPSQHEQLYDFLESCESYNVTAVKEKFDGTPVGRDYAVSRANLYKALRVAIYEANEETETEITRLLFQATNLMNKGLLNPVPDLLFATFTLAIPIEDFEGILKAIRILRDYLQHASVPAAERKKAVKYLNLEQEYLRKASNLRDWNLLLNKCFEMVADRPSSVDGWLRKLLADPLLQKDGICLSLRSQIVRYWVKDKILKAQKNTTARKGNIKEAIGFCEKHPAMLTDIQIMEFYLEACHNQAHYAIASGDKSLTERNVAKLEAALQFRDDIEVQVFGRIARLKAAHAVQFLDISYGKETTTYIQKGLKKYDGRVKQAVLLDLNYLLSAFWHFSGFPSKALPTVNAVRNKPVPVEKADLHFHAWLVFLFLQYELSNFSSLESFTQQTQRHFSKHGRKTDYEKILFWFFKKSVGAPGTKERMALLMTLKTKLTSLFKNPDIQYKLKYFPIFEWIEAQGSGTPLAVILASQTQD